MLTPDDVKDGMTFVLQLPSAPGGRDGGMHGAANGSDDPPVQWVETLRGDLARRWYEIFRQSDWVALRAEAADVFHRRVTETEAYAARTARHRCIFIHTPAVSASDLAAGRGSALVSVPAAAPDDREAAGGLHA